jgi:hypothetical protein
LSSVRARNPFKLDRNTAGKKKAKDTFEAMNRGFLFLLLRITNPLGDGNWNLRPKTVARYIIGSQTSPLLGRPRLDCITELQQKLQSFQGSNRFSPHVWGAFGSSNLNFAIFGVWKSF